MKSAFTALLLALALPAAYAAPPVETAQTLAEPGIWIDVRSPQEFQEGHLRQAVNVPLEEIAQQIGRLSSDKNTPLHLYCRSGRRAEAALQTLQQMGYTNVHNHGGYEDVKKRFAH